LRDVGAALLVDGNGADLAALELIAHVAVAKGGGTNGSAVLGLLSHLVADVGAICVRAVLVEGSQQTVHELAGRRLVDVLLR